MQTTTAPNAAHYIGNFVSDIGDGKSEDGDV